MSVLLLFVVSVGWIWTSFGAVWSKSRFTSRRFVDTNAHSRMRVVIVKLLREAQGDVHEIGDGSYVSRR